MITKHLDDLGATIRAMEQRTPSVRYERSTLWAQTALMREKLHKLDRVVSAIRMPDGGMCLRFDDGTFARGGSVWEALGPDCPCYARWLRAAYSYYHGDGSAAMSDAEWDRLAQEFALRKDEFYELRGTDWDGGSLFWLKFPDWAKK